MYLAYCIELGRLTIGENGDMLSKKGYQLRNAIAEAGFEVTPAELDEALMEAHERISGGPCRFCGKGDDNTELRFGMCFDCFKKD